MTHVNHTLALNIKMYVIYCPFYYSSSNLSLNLYKKKTTFYLFWKTEAFFKLFVIFDLSLSTIISDKTTQSFFERFLFVFKKMFPRFLVAKNDYFPIFGLWDFGI